MRRDKRGRYLGRLNFEERYYLEGFRIAAACIKSTQNWQGYIAAREYAKDRLKQLRVIRGNGERNTAFFDGEADAYLVAFGFA